MVYKSRGLLLLLLVVSLSACKQNTKSQPIVSKTPKAFIFHHEKKFPKVSSEKSPVLILLHGLGSNEKDLFSFAEHLDKRLMVIAPRAPITLAENKYSWYALERTSIDSFRYDSANLKEVSKQLVLFIDQVIATYPVDADRIYIGGFSQGAILTLGTALSAQDKVAGVLCLSGELYPEFAEHTPAKGQELKLFISHGRQDPVLKYDRMELAAADLKRKGFDVNFHSYNSSHTISQENFRDLRAWISGVIAN